MGISAGTNSIQHIYVGGPDYTPIQGPCDSGFHIPSTSEWEAVINTVGTVGADYFTYLHIPKCGYRDRKTTNIITTYGFSRYWCNTMTAKDKADCWGIEQTDLVQMYLDDKPANGYPIRAFKDAPVAPDSNWTETISGKVWYNATLGLISIKNGSEWITMQDKNVGATVVYNNGDTISNSNAGSFFQFGNYYGFSYSGTLSTYTSLQDTTGYGWQNPYSDSHFVKINSNNWFSNTNNDIWGGVTGVVSATEVLEVYRGTTKIRPTPTLVAHYPLTTTTTTSDTSGNGYDLTASTSSGIFGIYDGVNCASLSVNTKTLTGNVGDISQYTHTVSIRAKKTETSTSSNDNFRLIFLCGRGDNGHKGGVEGLERSGLTEKINLSFWYDDIEADGTYPINYWHNIVYVYNKEDNSQKIYVDGVLKGSRICTYTHTIYDSNNFRLGQQPWTTGMGFKGYVSDFIIWNGELSSSNILSYYNSTKSTYGIS